MSREVTIRDFQLADKGAIRAIFNQFVNDFAVYPEAELNEEEFGGLLKSARFILVVREGPSLVGFGFVSWLRPFQNFEKTGVLSYFFRPEYTGRGLGTKLLGELIRRGRSLGISNYIASISSKNAQSLMFHEKHGFSVVGRFRNVCVKKGENIDMVWVQKQIENG
jgi:phosphinothricin acetyltransferase